MKKYEKEIIQNRLDSEEQLIKELEKVYAKAAKDCADKIAALSARTDLENLQSIIYQKQYQQALKAEIDGILNLLHSQEFKTISEYLTVCYENGFIETMYSLHQQGIPLIIPIDQEAVVQAVQLDSNISEGLYNHLGESVTEMKKNIRAEVSRGVAGGQSYNQIAQNIAKGMNTPFTKAMFYATRIARTEGGRIANTAVIDGCYKARELGVDAKKEWSAVLDKRTRRSHAKVDGEVRELDEPFSNGLMFPCEKGGPAAEVINCRCVLQQVSKYDLNEAEYNRIKERAEYFGLDKTESLEDFKKKYLQVTDNISETNMSARASIQWGKPKTKISNEQYKEIMRYARDNNIALSGFKQFDGDVETVISLIDDAKSVANHYPAITENRKKLTIILEPNMHSDDFAVTRGHMISINANAYRDVSRLREEYNKLVEDGWFVAGTDYHAIIKHEIGHVVSNNYKVDCMALAKEIIGENSTTQTLEYLRKNLSEYSATYKDGSEIISECFASAYSSTKSNEFALKFLENYGNIILEKDKG